MKLKAVFNLRYGCYVKIEKYISKKLPETPENFCWKILINSDVTNLVDEFKSNEQSEAVKQTIKSYYDII